MGYEQAEDQLKIELQLASKRVEREWKKSRGRLTK